MHDARDAEDKRLLEAKEHTQLLENYVYLVQEWVSLRVRNREAADEVVQRVFERLARELAAGKTYPVPFRVVVWNVVNWKAQGTSGRPSSTPSSPSTGMTRARTRSPRRSAEYDLGLLFDDLPPGDREVLRLLYLETSRRRRSQTGSARTRNASTRPSTAVIGRWGEKLVA